MFDPISNRQRGDDVVLEAEVGIGLDHRFRDEENGRNPRKIKDASPVFATIVRYFLLRSLTVSPAMNFRFSCRHTQVCWQGNDLR